MAVAPDPSSAQSTATAATSTAMSGATVSGSLERLPNNTPRFHGCSRIGEYEYICKLGEGTFGEVSKARSKKTGQVVALKKILMHNEKDGFPITALREIKLLKQLDHVNILKLTEMAVERPKNASKKTSMFMVTPYMDHDLAGLLENPSVQFTEPQIKCYMQQLLRGTAYLHANKILHRDMKAANLLINNQGILQIADFGLARPYDDEPPQRGKGGGEATREYTTLVVTRWYRPPELLLQLRKYTTAIDLWGVGCVFGEMFKRKPILPGTSDLHQAQIIFDLVGSPTEESMPGWSSLPGVDGNLVFAERTSSLRSVFKDQPATAVSLLEQLLTLDWRKRINAIDALEHPYFSTPPLPARPADLPKFDDSHELDRRKLRDQKNKPPPAPAGGSVGIQAHGEWAINSRPGGGNSNNIHSSNNNNNNSYRRPHQQQTYHDRDRDRGRDRNGTRHNDYRDRDQHRNYPAQDSRRPLPYDDQPYSRRPPQQQQQQQQTLIPDTSLPARPPVPADVDRSYRERGERGRGLGRDREMGRDRDRDRIQDRDRAYPRPRVIPPPSSGSGPQYSSTDHNTNNSPSSSRGMVRRPLPVRDEYEYNHDRDREYDRDRDRDRDRMYEHRRRSPYSNSNISNSNDISNSNINNRRPSREYDYGGHDYSHPHSHSHDYNYGYDAAGGGGGGGGGAPSLRYEDGNNSGTAMSTSADRRRSRSPGRRVPIGYENSSNHGHSHGHGHGHGHSGQSHSYGYGHGQYRR